MTRIPFTAYDFFAYLSSGGVLVAAVDFLYGYQWLLEEGLSAPTVLLLLFLSYLAGHVVAGASSPLLEQIFVGRLLKRPSLVLLRESSNGLLVRLFPGYYRPLPSSTRQRIAHQAASRGFTGEGEALFAHAYGIVTADPAAQARLDEFRNLYGFARNMALALLVVALLFVAGVEATPRSQTTQWAAVAAFLGVAMLYRYLKFFRQYSYQLLLAYAELEHPSSGDAET